MPQHVIERAAAVFRLNAIIASFVAVASFNYREMLAIVRSSLVRH